MFDLYEENLFGFSYFTSLNILFIFKKKITKDSNIKSSLTLD